MNIVLLGHEDIASLYALDLLIRQAQGHRFTVCWSGSMAAHRERAPVLEQLEATDRTLYQRYLGRPQTAAALREAIELKAPNSPEGLEQLAALKPDLAVSVRYRRILKDDAIAIPAHGVLNLHSGILPDYRGVMATFWAMLNKEPSVGTTLHRIVDAGIDTGPVIQIQRMPTDYSASYLANVLALYADGCSNIARAIDEIDRNGTVPTTEMPAGAGRYYGPPAEADAVKFLKTGGKLADGSELRTLRTNVRSS